MISPPVFLHHLDPDHLAGKIITFITSITSITFITSLEVGSSAHQATWGRGDKGDKGDEVIFCEHITFFHIEKHNPNVADF